MTTVIQNTIAPSMALNSYVSNQFNIPKNGVEAFAEAALTYMQNGQFTGIDVSEGTHMITQQNGESGQRLHFIA